MTQLVSTEKLEAALAEFAKERDWEKFHSPKNLVMALINEAGELTEIFQWLTEEQSKAVVNDKEVIQHVGEEIADVLLYLVRLASVLGVNIDAVVARKIEINRLKYPACF